jgi:signal transduction histidine kinase
VRELGFEAALRAAAAPFPSARRICLDVRGSVPDDVLAQSPLLPVARELLVNAIKHARPSAIDVSVAVGDEGILLEISDDGAGIDASGPDRAVQAGHVALALVRRRVQDAGGEFEISHARGRRDVLARCAAASAGCRSRRSSLGCNRLQPTR